MSVSESRSNITISFFPTSLLRPPLSFIIQGLKERLEELIPKKQAQIKEFRKAAGNQVVGEVTVDMMYGGMRGIKGE